MPEATMENGIPQTAGWFVVNARDAPWMHNDMRSVCKFGGEGEARFDNLGIGLYWLQPGKPMAMYHHEAGQEDFLVLRGAAVVIVEGTERPLRPLPGQRDRAPARRASIARRHRRRGPTRGSTRRDAARRLRCSEPTPARTTPRA